MDILDYLYIYGEKKSPVPPSKESKTDVQGYYKTPSGAVVSKDKNSLAAYKIRKNKSAKLNKLEDRIIRLETGIEEIKELLKGLQNK